MSLCTLHLHPHVIMHVKDAERRRGIWYGGVNQGQEGGALHLHWEMYVERGGNEVRRWKGERRRVNVGPFELG